LAVHPKPDRDGHEQALVAAVEVEATFRATVVDETSTLPAAAMMICCNSRCA
jgi:hypothetical protein